MDRRFNFVIFCFFLFFSLIGIIVFFNENNTSSFIDTIISPEIIKRLFYVAISVLMLILFQKIPIFLKFSFTILILFIGYFFTILSLFISFNGKLVYNSIHIPTELILSFSVINFLTNVISFKNQKIIDALIYSLTTSTSILLLFLNQKFAFSIILFLTLLILSFSYSFKFALKTLTFNILLIAIIIFLLIIKSDFIKEFTNGISVNSEFMFFNKDTYSILTSYSKNISKIIESSLFSPEKFLAFKYGFTFFFFSYFCILTIGFISMHTVNIYKNNNTIIKTEVFKIYAFSLFIILWMIVYILSLLYSNPLLMCNMPFFTYSNIEYLMISLIIISLYPHKKKKILNKSDVIDE